MKIVSVIVLFGLWLHASDAWSYLGNDGVDYWSKTFATCGDRQQSPINIMDGDTVYKNIDPIRLVGWDQAPGKMKISNNGHSVTVSIEEGSFNVTGGGLGTTFTVAQFHFHWGVDNTKGSEHTVDNRQYPLELHIVTYNSTYSDVGTAASEPDGLAVLGIFFDTMTVDTLANRPIPSSDNKALDRVLDHIQKASHKGNESFITPFRLDELTPRESELADFYRYNGSLTTPPCYESVQWTVFKWINYVSESQMDQFRSIFENAVEDTDKTIVDNFRPVQNLYGRTVWVSKYNNGAQYLLPSITVLVISFMLQLS